MARPRTPVFIVIAILCFLLLFLTQATDHKPPFHISTLPHVGVSHNPEIRKQVLASYMQLPHVTQIALATLKPGQVASENVHKDMTEMFIFIKGAGILRLDHVNHSISDGSVAIIHPYTRHTIYNVGDNDLQLYTIASV